MKTKLFYLFIAVFLFSTSGKSQTNAKTAVSESPVITLIGSGNGGWTDTAETPMLTDDGINYSLVDKILTDGEVKFREGKCWEAGCAGTVTNTFGWGPIKAVLPAVQDTGWPSGTNAVPEAGTPNIQSKAGVWTINFNRIQGTWSFVAGAPLPVIKLVGTAVSNPEGLVLTSDLTGTFFSAKKVTLVAGTCQFSIDGVLAGALTFPNGDATEGSDAMTIATTGIDYDVTFDYSLYKYTFTVATFPSIAIVGDGTQGGWPPYPQPVEYVEPVTGVMKTTDGVTYTLANVPLITGKVKFRQDNSWNTNWGGDSWPSGSTTGNDIPSVAGNYNVTFNKTNNTYNFSLNTVAVVGSGVPGSWPPYPQPDGYLDPNVMSTVDGVNYTFDGLVVTDGAAKFRQNNSWSVNSGGALWPAGSKTDGDIPSLAGTYNLKYNIITGAYDFGTALAVKNFNAGSFKAYPNPTKSSWNISSNDDITSVKVFDVLGKSVYAKSASSKEVTVNAAELSKGIYFAKVSTANGTSTVKLVKE
jgi:hypothetical protein